MRSRRFIKFSTMWSTVVDHKSERQAAAGSGNAQSSIIIVEVLGFGGGGREGSEDRQSKKGSRSSADGNSYDPNSKFQVIGNGELTEQQKKKLTDEERKQL